MQNQSAPSRGAPDDFVDRCYSCVAQAHRSDIRTREAVDVDLWATRRARTRSFHAALRRARRLQKIISLFLSDRSLEPLEHLQHIFPDFPLLRRCLVPQQVGGV